MSIFLKEIVYLHFKTVYTEHILQKFFLSDLIVHIFI